MEPEAYPPDYVRYDLDVTQFMSPERIVGALIWFVWNDELAEDLLDLAGKIPPEHLNNLEGDLDQLVKMAWGANRDPEAHLGLLDTLLGKIMSTLNTVSGADVSALMTVERIIGAMLWSLGHGKLSNGLFDLVDTIPQDVIPGLGWDLYHIIKSLQNGVYDPKYRINLISWVQTFLRKHQPKDPMITPGGER